MYLPTPTLIRRGRLAAPATLAATALLVAACSSAGTGGTAGPTTVATQPPATTEASPEASQAAAPYAVELANDAKLGMFLTGEGGKTLYLFTPDTATTSNCNAGCIESWPAFTLEAGETVKGGDGVTGTFATMKRQDGSMQVTYAGHPLYYYGADQAAGDVNGQALYDKWYVVGADGNPIKAGPKASGGKYGY